MDVDCVFLRGRALTQILGYAIEVYKQECTGVLLGDIFETRNKIVVNSAIALQSAERAFSHVTTSDKRYERITEVLSFLALDWLVGGFHSHTEWGGNRPSYQLSEEDIEYMDKMYFPGEIEIVVAIRDKRRNYAWGYIDDNRVLRGTIGDYEVRLAAHCNAEDEVYLTEVWAPIIEIANVANEIGLAPKDGYIFEFIPPEFNKNKFRRLVRLVRKYEDVLIQKADEDSGAPLLDEITLLMREIAALTNIYWHSS